MNLIDFVVRKIISEEKGFMYEFNNMTKEEAENEKEDFWREYLLSHGIKQVIEVEDMGGKQIKTKYINLDKGEKPYKVGDNGLH